MGDFDLDDFESQIENFDSAGSAFSSMATKDTPPPKSKFKAAVEPTAPESPYAGSRPLASTASTDTGKASPNAAVKPASAPPASPPAANKQPAAPVAASKQPTTPMVASKQPDQGTAPKALSQAAPPAMPQANVVSVPLAAKMPKGN